MLRINQWPEQRVHSAATEKCKHMLGFTYYIAVKLIGIMCVLCVLRFINCGHVVSF